MNKDYYIERPSCRTTTKKEKALLLFLYRCPYDNSYALDFLKEL